VRCIELLLRWMVSVLETFTPESSVKGHPPAGDPASSTLRLHTICVRCASTGVMTVGSSNGSVVTEWDTQTPTSSTIGKVSECSGSGASTDVTVAVANPNRTRR
jgi:hypothetical protein